MKGGHSHPSDQLFKSRSTFGFILVDYQTGL